MICNIKNIHTLKCLIGALLISLNAIAQTEPIYNLYQLNPQVYAPSHAGSTQVSDVQLIYRNQWIGMEGAPKTFFATANLKWKEKKGLGMSFFVDEVGLVKTSSASADFAYHTSLSENWVLSGGIRGSLSTIFLDFSKVFLLDNNDLVFQGSRSSGLQPRLGFGLKISSKKGFFANFSMPRLGKYKIDDKSGSFKDVNYMFISVGKSFNVGTLKTNKKGDSYTPLVITPSILTRIADDVPLSLDVNLLTTILDKMDLGVGLRAEDSYHFRVGIHASKNYLLTYVYEKPFSQISKITGMTNEIGLKISFKK